MRKVLDVMKTVGLAVGVLFAMCLLPLYIVADAACEISSALFGTPAGDRSRWEKYRRLGRWAAANAPGLIGGGFVAAIAIRVLAGPLGWARSMGLVAVIGVLIYGAYEVGRSH